MSGNEAVVTSLADAVDDADTVVALTGAGVSTASGIPDFRGEDGLWDRHDPMDFHVDRFRRDPGGFWADRVELQAEIDAADVEPNAAHDALADLETAGHLDGVITQNIDGLHQAAGSDTVVEIHGSAARVVCQGCGERRPAGPITDRARGGDLPPTCADCGGTYKPDTVLFGEQLPDHAFARSQTLVRDADVFLAIGSSLTVEPVASFPRTAADASATLAIVNLDETPLSDRADYDVRGDVTEVLPRLRDALVDE